jgi:sulfate/thiosulfate transport system permease protein
MRGSIGRLVGTGLAVTYLSLLVVLPLAALASKAFSSGFGTFWQQVTNPEAVAALKLTLIASLIVAAFNALAGLVIAWVLVRDEFPGKQVVNAVIDLPFALPTVVAGLTLIALYGPDSPFHLNVADTRIGILFALAFVTLPFSVRSVQPVLAELDREVEEAASSLGASTWGVLRRVILPSIAPAMLAGAGLAFARAVGEFGSVGLISGNLPFKTEVASVKILSLIENDNPAGAAAIASVLLAVSVVTLVSIDLLQRWAARRA